MFDDGFRMSELRSVVESLRAATLAETPDALIEERYDEIHRAAEQLEMERLRTLAEIEARRVFERDGHLSCASWLVTRFRMRWSEAHAKVRLARSLERMPVTRCAIEDDGISMAAARVLAEAERAHPAAFARAEASLVEAARIHTVGELQQVATFWSHQVEEEEQALGEERLRAKRTLYTSRTFGGMVRVDGDLDPETGETLLTALGAVLDAEARPRMQEDGRSPAQRRADALGELCRQWLDRTDRPHVGGERPHVTVTVGLETLKGEGGAAELDRAGVVAGDVARRIACDASIQRVVLSPRSEPLDVGRRTSVVPPALRRAVRVRDRHCRFPGCDRPAGWCEAHHVVHWAHGGRTSLPNLVLLCRRHHRLVHERGFRLVMSGGRPEFTRPDGTRLDDRAPPAGVAV